MENKNIVYQTALQYVEYKIFNLRINIPYMINQSDRYCSSITRGKAPLNEIAQEFQKEAKRHKLNITCLSPEKIKTTMQSFGIGIDCSGFAYHILNPLVKLKTGKDLSNFLVRFSGLLGKIDKTLLRNKRYEKISAAQLTSSINTIGIYDVLDIKVGDIIRMTHRGYEGKHPLVVVEVTSKYILYAHSSEYVEENGAHFGKIIIHNIKDGLNKQEWLEKTKMGKIMV